MKGRIRDFLLYCESLDFGKGELSETKSCFYRQFNSEILSLCRSLPESAQTDAMLFLMQYSGVHLGDELDFFANYYPPIWSILYWLSHDRTLPTERLNDRDMTNAVTAQSTSMFLHSLDDHLVDGQVSVAPLTLLLRSQAWTIMNRSFCNLAEGVPAGGETIRRFIDAYYLSNQDSKEPQSLDNYCDRFRSQMAIVTIAPILLCMKISGVSDFTRDIEIAYGSFGIAWRLLDDIKDIGEDMKKGARSSIYLCLPEQLRTQWRNNIGTQVAVKDSVSAILDHILEHSLIDKLKERICCELETAASIVEAYNMAGLAGEFRCLADPLRSNGSTKENCNGRSGISRASKQLPQC